MSTPTVFRSVEVPSNAWAAVEVCVPVQDRTAFLERALMDGLLRYAAERARRYYETDEEALAWAEFGLDLVDQDA